MNDSFEGRSKLTFVASCDSTDRVEVGQLRRVREPVSRSKSGVQGKVSDGQSIAADDYEPGKNFKALGQVWWDELQLRFFDCPHLVRHR